GNRRDDRRPDPPDPVPALEMARAVKLERGRAREVADVRSGREGTARPREDDRPDRRVRVERLERLDELRHQLSRQRIERLRPVERDERERLLSLDEDERLGAHSTITSTHCTELFM